MPIRKIISYPNEILEKESTFVKKIDEEATSIVQDLIDTLCSTTGVGLSAPQIGINKRIFIYDHNRVEMNNVRNYKVLINPKIISTMKIIKDNGEGCKSLQSFFISVPRYREILVEGLDEQGQFVSVNAKGYEACVLQHEIDHLNGRLIFQNIGLKPNRVVLYNWYVSNLNNIVSRIGYLKDFQDGIIFNDNKIVVKKDKNQVQLYFSSDKDSETLTGIMSRIDLIDPLYLLAIYSQAMALTLLWEKTPKNIYILGFGGGRLSMFFHHYFPKIKIISTETEQSLIKISEKYFGIEFDNRMKVEVEDGKSFLEKSRKKFDIILLDAFDSLGFSPSHLTTANFYNLCKEHLTEKGIVSANFIGNDPLLQDKILVFSKSFKTTYKYSGDGSCVLFGTNQYDIGIKKLIKKSFKLYSKYCFSFPFIENAKKLSILVH